MRHGAEAGSRSGRRGAGADEEERKETKETALLWLTGGRGSKKPWWRPGLGQEAERCERAMMVATPLSATSLARSRGGGAEEGAEQRNEVDGD